MRKLSFLLVGVLLFCSISTIVAQDHNSEEAQKAWQEYMAPGDMHSVLARVAGEWNAKVSMWNDPTGEPMVSGSRILVAGAHVSDSAALQTCTSPSTSKAISIL